MVKPTGSEESDHFSLSQNLNMPDQSQVYLHRIGETTNNKCPWNPKSEPNKSYCLTPTSYGIRLFIAANILNSGAGKIRYSTTEANQSIKIINFYNKKRYFFLQAKANKQL